MATVLLLPALLLFGATQVMAAQTDSPDALSAAIILGSRPKVAGVDVARITVQVPDGPAPPDLSGSVKTVTPGSVPAGGVLSYTIVLSNSGDLSATVSLSDTMPGYTSFISGSLYATTGTASYSATVATVFWQGVVLPTEPVSISFSVMVTSLTPGGTIITNTAVFSHDGTVYERSAAASIIPTAADLTPSVKTVTPTALYAGEQMSYTIVLENAGETAAVTFLEDFLPTEVTYVAGSLNATSGTALYNPVQKAVFWDGTVAAGVPVSITFSVVVVPGTTGGTLITNTAIFSHDAIDYERSAVAYVIPTPADLSPSEKVVTPTTAYAGDTLSYAVYFRNDGETPASVSMTDTLPLDTTYVAGSLSASSGTAFYFPPQRTVFWVGDVALGMPVSITFDVATDGDIVSGTLITNYAEYSLNHTVYELSATTEITTPPPIDLSGSTKTVTPTLVFPGDLVTFTVTLENSGAQTATVILTDTVPVSTTFVIGSLSATGGTAVYSPTLNAILWYGDLLSGGNVTIVFAVLVSDTVTPGQLITNIADFTAGGLVYQRSATTKVGHWMWFPIMLKQP